jgi:hypothetical protein
MRSPSCASGSASRFSSTSSALRVVAFTTAVKQRSASLCFCAVLAAASPAQSQDITAATLSISGTVVGSNDSPLPFSTASLRETGVERFSNDRGEFVMSNLAPGEYHLRVKQLGFAAFDTSIILRAELSRVQLRVMLSPIPFKLTTVTIRSTRGCVAPDESLAGESDFQAILAELRKNADRERLLVSSYPFEYRIARSLVSQDPEAVPSWGGRDTVTYRSDQRPRYSPGGVVRTDAAAEPPNNRIMTIPALEDLGDPAFLKSHCFIYGGRKSESGALTHRIDFRPEKTLTSPDIEGSVYLDVISFVIRRAIFRLTRPDDLVPPVRNLEVTTSYREIFPGVAVVGEVRSVQNVVATASILSKTVRLTERQQLVDVRFLKGQPGDTIHIR